MKYIYKYPLYPFGHTEIKCRLRRFLKADLQNDVAVVWLELSEDEPEHMIFIEAFPTGDKFETKGEYIGTVQHRNGLVEHLYLTDEDISETQEISLLDALIDAAYRT